MTKIKRTKELVSLTLPVYRNRHNDGFSPWGSLCMMLMGYPEDRWKDKLFKKVMKKMGFHNINDYVLSYPGKSTTHSSIFIKLHRDSNLYDEESIHKYYLDKDPELDLDALFFVWGTEVNRTYRFTNELKTMGKYDTLYMLVTPTVEQVLRWTKANGDDACQLTYNDCWFCLDWKER